MNPDRIRDIVEGRYRIGMDVLLSAQSRHALLPDWPENQAQPWRRW